MVRANQGSRYGEPICVQKSFVINVQNGRKKEAGKPSANSVNVSIPMSSGVSKEVDLGRSVSFSTLPEFPDLDDEPNPMYIVNMHPDFVEESGAKVEQGAGPGTEKGDESGQAARKEEGSSGASRMFRARLQVNQGGENTPMYAGECTSLTFAFSHYVNDTPLMDLDPYIGEALHLVIVKDDLAEVQHIHGMFVERGQVIGGDGDSSSSSSSVDDAGDVGDVNEEEVAEATGSPTVEEPPSPANGILFIGSDGGGQTLPSEGQLIDISDTSERENGKGNELNDGAVMDLCHQNTGMMSGGKTEGVDMSLLGPDIVAYVRIKKPGRYAVFAEGRRKRQVLLVRFLLEVQPFTVVVGMEPEVPVVNETARITIAVEDREGNTLGSKGSSARSLKGGVMRNFELFFISDDFDVLQRADLQGKDN
ncbi:hypothetical protein CBR_g37943 [Chara braunii]|uniref:Uncharacterized protein n=1 Tax=Chara braunii TaxID=69332 RepID=A0A388LP17_CHABU|nr:hypothetical protein CBR_g37943 [Chara braunii]|eukprot:GBG84068.1 hypothetical protein CBR_g37943 [Chara braunii]